jgi:3-oxoacyl-[acyl-carrier protein] reductase
MNLDLEGRRAIVTGGSRGIGRAIVQTLADEGCAVAFCARGAEGVQAAVEASRDARAPVTGAAVDVGDADAFRSWLAESMEALGGLDILISNTTGYALPGEDGWRSTLEVDVLGLVRGVEVTLPALEASGQGSIVVLGSSTAVDIFLPGGEAYGAMKAATIHHSSVLAKAHGRRGIRCNTVSPGPIEFEGNIWRRRHEEGNETYETLRASSPFGRMGTAEEVANAVVFLASPAASWVTGINLIVDGGMTTRVNF